MRSLPQPDQAVETIGRADRPRLPRPARQEGGRRRPAHPDRARRPARRLVRPPAAPGDRSWSRWAAGSRPACSTCCPAGAGRRPGPWSALGVVGARADRDRRLGRLGRPAPAAAADRAGARRRQRGHRRPPVRLLAGPPARPAGPRRGAQPGRARRRQRRGVPRRPPGLPAGRRDRPRRGGGAGPAAAVDPAGRGWTSCPTAQPTRRTLDGVPVFVLRRGQQVDVLYDLCSHLSGPLSEGELSGAGDEMCITCPWHGSTFRLRDGAGTAGPDDLPAAGAAGPGRPRWFRAGPTARKRTDHGTRQQQALAPARRRDGARGRGDDDGRAPDPRRGMARARARGRGPARPRPARASRRASSPASPAG